MPRKSDARKGKCSLKSSDIDRAVFIQPSMWTRATFSSTPCLARISSCTLAFSCSILNINSGSMLFFRRPASASRGRSCSQKNSCVVRFSAWPTALRTNESIFCECLIRKASTASLLLLKVLNMLFTSIVLASNFSASRRRDTRDDKR